MTKKSIWKYDVPIIDDFSIMMPEGAELLTVQVQHDIPRIWALIDPTKRDIDKQFRLAGTGHFISEDNVKYIGSFQLFEGKLVYHLFEVI